MQALPFLQLLPGFLLTLHLVLWATLFALLWTFCLTLLYQLGPLRGQQFVSAYCNVFRSIPLLIQLYFYYRGLPHLGIVLSPELCGIVGLTLYTSAYLCEALRSGLEALPATQRWAGLALGFSRFKVLLEVELPQALALTLGPITNLLIGQTKNTSLLAFITVEELFHGIYAGAVDRFNPISYFIAGAILYGALSLSVAGLGAVFRQRFHQRLSTIPLPGAEKGFFQENAS